MRRIFITTILVLCAICGMRAQSDTVTVHVDGTTSLESLMEGVWEQGGECLRLTGTPTEEDISYLHEILISEEKQFTTFDFKELELRRIPKKFFLGIKGFPIIILPKCLEYIEDGDWGVVEAEFVLTGKFLNKFRYYFSASYMRVSRDNKYCKEFEYHEVSTEGDAYSRYSIYSMDEKIFYLSTIDSKGAYIDNHEMAPVVIREGTEIINGYALYHYDGITILPESLDSIGDWAFWNGYITCNAISPPKLGYSALGYMYELYVPEESFDDYMNTPLWNTADFTNGIQTGRVNISESTYIKIDCKRVAASYIITSYIPMKNISIYTLEGMLLKNDIMDVKEYKINLQSFPKSPLLLYVELENGECETIKIIP